MQLPSFLSYALTILRLMSLSEFPAPLNVYDTDVKNFNDYVSRNPAPAPLPVPNSTKSFWLHPQSEVNPLADEGSEGQLIQSADVCIIGSGITGVSAAYHFSRAIPDKRLVVLEAREFCTHIRHAKFSISF